MKGRGVSLLSLPFVLLVLGGCAATVSSTYLDWVQRSHTHEFSSRLGGGDVVEINVFREPNLSGELTLDADGTVRFPLLGRVSVAGMGCREVEDYLIEALSGEFLQNPSVSCRVVEQKSLRVLVVGQVRTPMSVAYRDGLTVVEAVALAGGASSEAGQDRVIVTRVLDGEQHEIEVPLRLVMSGRAPNFFLWPNDTVFVPTSRLFQ